MTNTQALPLKKILVIRLSSFGDIILSFPLLKKLKEKFPQSELHFLTKKNYKDLVSLNPCIDRVIISDDQLLKTRNEIAAEKYDLIIDIHKNFRSIYLSLLNAKKIVRYSKENFKKFLLVKFKINLFKEIIPVYKKYLLALSKYTEVTDYSFATSDLEFDNARIIKEKYIVISPSSRHFTKTYPAEKFVKFINDSLDKRFVLTGDDTPNDKLICEFIETNCKNVSNLCGKLSMKELANVLYNSDLVICNDSAILHFAEALGKKVLAIFGSTVKEFGFFPQLIESKVLEIKNLKCRPCTHIGRDACPLKHFKCMEEIELIVSS